MVISVPALLSAGFWFAAMALIAIPFSLWTRNRAFVVICVVSGLLSCGLLAYLLGATGRSLDGAQQWGWVVAFLAGYSAGAPVGVVIWLAQMRKLRAI